MDSNETMTTFYNPSSSSSPSPATSPPPPPVIQSPCAACKILRRRCADKCILAPYFPPTDPLKFTTAHRVFGASNIIKLLQVFFVLYILHLSFIKKFRIFCLYWYNLALLYIDLFTIIFNRNFQRAKEQMQWLAWYMKLRYIFLI